MAFNSPLPSSVHAVLRSNKFVGLSHADRVAMVFEALHDGLAAGQHPLLSPASSYPPSSPTDGASECRSAPRDSPASSQLQTPTNCAARMKSNRAESAERARYGRQAQENFAHQALPPNETFRRVPTTTPEQLRPRMPLDGVRGVRGAIKASYLGRNVESLPVWGGLDGVQGATLLLDCRTPAQWRPRDFPASQEAS